MGRKRILIKFKVNISLSLFIIVYIIMEKNNFEILLEESMRVEWEKYIEMITKRIF